MFLEKSKLGKANQIQNENKNIKKIEKAFPHSKAPVVTKAVEKKANAAKDGAKAIHKINEAHKIVKNVDENVAKELKHTPPPQCHGERKEADPHAAEEYKAKKHTRPTKPKRPTKIASKTRLPAKAKLTTTAKLASKTRFAAKAKLTTTTKLATTKLATTTKLTTTKLATTTKTAVTGSTKKSTKRHGVKFDDKGDSVWVDDSNDSPDSSDERVKNKEAKVDANGNMIDTQNQASGDRNEKSEEESEESDGIPIITIPLVDILNKYARMMGGKRASNSRYEYSYEDENDIKIKEIKERVLDEASAED